MYLLLTSEVWDVEIKKHLGLKLFGLVNCEDEFLPRNEEEEEKKIKTKKGDGVQEEEERPLKIDGDIVAEISNF